MRKDLTAEEVMIAIRNNIRYRRVQIFKTCGNKAETCVVEIFVGGELFILVMCYRRPNIVFITIE